MGRQFRYFMVDEKNIRVVMEAKPIRSLTIFRGDRTWFCNQNATVELYRGGRSAQTRRWRKQDRIFKREPKAGCLPRSRSRRHTIPGTPAPKAATGSRINGIPATVADACGRSYTPNSRPKGLFGNLMTGFTANADIDRTIAHREKPEKAIGG